MDKLGDLWKEQLNIKANEKQKKNIARQKEEAINWADRMIAITESKIKNQIYNNLRDLDDYIEVGEFPPNQLKLVGEGDYFPKRAELTNGAELFYDWCDEQNLRIKVGGDFKMSGTWCAPYEIYVTFK